MSNFEVFKGEFRRFLAHGCCLGLYEVQVQLLSDCMHCLSMSDLSKHAGCLGAVLQAGRATVQLLKFQQSGCAAVPAGGLYEVQIQLMYTIHAPSMRSWAEPQAAWGRFRRRYSSTVSFTHQILFLATKLLSWARLAQDRHSWRSKTQHILGHTHPAQCWKCMTDDILSENSCRLPEGCTRCRRAYQAHVSRCHAPCAQHC